MLPHIWTKLPAAPDRCWTGESVQFLCSTAGPVSCVGVLAVATGVVEDQVVLAGYSPLHTTGTILSGDEFIRDKFSHLFRLVCLEL